MKLHLLGSAFACALTTSVIALPHVVYASETKQQDTLSGTPMIDPELNTIGITKQDGILWNHRPITVVQLEMLLQQATAMEVEPELRFEPDPNASYERAVEVLMLIKASRVTKFGFLGNERADPSASTSD